MRTIEEIKDNTKKLEELLALVREATRVTEKLIAINESLLKDIHYVG